MAADTATPDTLAARMAARLVLELVQEGATVWPPESSLATDDTGVRYRLDIEHDDHHVAPWEEYDTYGRAAWRDARQGRPADMDGAACIIHRNRGDVLWWQPPADVIGDPEAQRAVHDYVIGYVRNDWTYVTVEVTVFRPCTHCGGGHEQTAALGGVESNSGAAYLTEVVTDLLIQCDVPHERPTPRPEATPA